MTEQIDEFLDSMVAPPCKAIIHRVPAEAGPYLIRAYERTQAGEKLNGSAFAKALNQKFGTEVSGSNIVHWMQNGCHCDA